MQRIAVEHLPGRGDGDVGAVVDVEAEELPFGLHQSNHQEPLARNACLLLLLLGIRSMAESSPFASGWGDSKWLIVAFQSAE